MSAMPRITVIGSINMDLVIRAPRLPRTGETLFGEGFSMVPGGKGANQAVTAARIGAQVTFVGKVGRDIFGEELRTSLARERVDTRYLFTDDHAATGVALIVIDNSGDNSILVAPGANMRCNPEDVDAAAEELAAADVLLLQLEIPLETDDYAISLAKRHQVPVILDAGPASQRAVSNLKQIDILSPNETEAEALTGVKVSGLKGAEQACRSLLSKGVGTVVLKLGAQGAMIGDRDGIRHIPGVKVHVVDTTAAGDAFTAALAVALGEGKGIDEVVVWANHVGALTVTRLGAQTSLPTREEVDRFIKP
ncbi:MAG TPA: ribokinase [Candidatus Latescibacteria bacterium]|nr:ribokinase [Candidatus Latescibacterota bacterium]